MVATERPDPTQTLETITPALAQDWLQCNIANRRLSKAKTADYADAIRRGEWAESGESIKFDWDGILIDGQNRLTAVVDTGMSIRSFVTRGLAPEVKLVLDTGLKRTGGHILTMAGEASAILLSSAMQHLGAYLDGRMGATSASFRRALSHPQLMQVLEDHPNLRQSVGWAASTRGPLIVPSEVAFLHYIFQAAAGDTAEAEMFLGSTIEGSFLSPGEPILALRNRLLRPSNANYQLSKNAKMALCIKAWNFYRAGATIKKLVWQPREGFPKPE